MDSKKPFANIASVLIIVVFFSLGIALGNVWASTTLSKKLDLFIEVLDFVKNDYVDKNLDDTKLVYGAIKGLLAALDDPYTRFLEPQPYKEMKTRMKGEYGGIGIYIGIKDDRLTVISPIEDTPAYHAGLKSGDSIVSIDDKPTTDMALDEAVSLIRGKKGAKVRLGIIRGEGKDPKEYAITRDQILIKSVKAENLGNRIGYVKLITFENANSSDAMEESIKLLKKEGMTSLIVDVRNNGGGLLQNAIEIASLFLGQGDTVVYTVDRNGKKDVLEASGDKIWSGPMVILINGASASASEILAGAIQDNNRGKVVGTHSFGKASVQNIKQLDDGSAVLLTVAKYFTPKGTDINKTGIIPDVVVEIPTEEAIALASLEVVAEKDKMEQDRQLLKAIEILKGQ